MGGYEAAQRLIDDAEAVNRFGWDVVGVRRFNLLLEVDRCLAADYGELLIKTPALCGVVPRRFTMRRGAAVERYADHGLEGLGYMLAVRNLAHAVHDIKTGKL